MIRWASYEAVPLEAENQTVWQIGIQVLDARRCEKPHDET